MVNLYWGSKAPWLGSLEDQGITASLEFSRIIDMIIGGDFRVCRSTCFLTFDVLTEIHICILLYCIFVVKINSKSK